MNDDEFSIILSYCDCGSSFKEQSLVCRMWRYELQRLFPEADVLFANPVRTLMGLWNIRPTKFSRWLSYGENVSIIYKQFEYLVLNKTRTPIPRIDALAKGIVCPSYLSSDGDVLTFLFDGFYTFHRKEHLITDFLERNIHVLTEYVIMNDKRINEQYVTILAIMEGKISLEFTKKLCESGRIYEKADIYHKHQPIGSRYCDEQLDVRDGRFLYYVKCCYESGVEIIDLWDLVIKNNPLVRRGSIHKVICPFLRTLNGKININYFWEVLVPIAKEVVEIDETIILKDSLKYCDYTWKDVLKFEGMFKSKQELLDLVCFRM